jgi:hypothetical protein
LRRGWTRFWREGKSRPSKGADARRLSRNFAAFFCAALIPQFAAGQSPPSPASPHVSTTHRPSAKSSPTSAMHRNDELTLAGLRPGQDDLAKAQKLFRKPSVTKFDGTNPIWRDACRSQSLSIITDADSGTIQEVRVSENNSKFASATPASTVTEPGCAAAADTRTRWMTGHGLFIGSSCSRVFELYGQPGSRGPSTKDGQQLELLYYAFDWAGPDVPQVMAILCTPGTSAKPGRVVEITLMAPSL